MNHGDIIIDGEDIFGNGVNGAARVEALADPGGTTGAATFPAAPLQPTIAVLHFDNRGTATDQSYYSDGVTEDVIAALGRFSGLLVLPWNAVASTEGQLARATHRALAFGADYFVSGSDQRSDTKIRLSVQLSEAASLFLRAAAHAMLEEREEAERLAAAGLARYPFFNVTGFAQIFTRDENRALVVEGLQKIGFERHRTALDRCGVEK